LDSRHQANPKIAGFNPRISAQRVYAIANGTRKPSLEALEAIINAFRENGLETTLEDLVKVKI
jgi:hypothetical protein